MKTPILSHLTSQHYQNIYEPSDDTFLLLDALELEQNSIKKLKPSICFEVGVGSGVVMTFLSQLLKENNQNCFFMGCDCNEFATQATQKTLLSNIQNSHSDVLLMDLFSSLRKTRFIDVLIFNPPYVVTPSSEVGQRSLTASWAGGEKGRQVIDRFFFVMESFLTLSGVIYMVLIQDNDPSELNSILSQRGYCNELILTRQCYNELLFVYKYFKASIEL